MSYGGPAVSDRAEEKDEGVHKAKNTVREKEEGFRKEPKRGEMNGTPRSRGIEPGNISTSVQLS